MKTFPRILIPFGLLATQALATLPVVSNVTASQRADSKLVDIHYDVEDADGDALKIRVEVSDNAGTRYSVPAFSFTGDIGDNIAPGDGKHIVWDAGVDWDGEYSDQMRVKVIAVDGKGLPGLEWGSEVPAGGFLMGQDGGAEGTGPSRHVNIPWSYWLSKYEITVAQYCEFLNTALVSGEVVRDGTTEVWAVDGKFDGIPANGLLLKIGDDYDIAWNVNNFEPVPDMENRPVSVTWYGALAFALHYGYDLPTAAEWEKAARGPDHDDEDEHLVYPWGDTLTAGHANYRKSADPYDSNDSYYEATARAVSNKTPVGYYNGDQVPLGPDTANAHGLYDLVGNVTEWTRSLVVDVESYPQKESLTTEINVYNNLATVRTTKGGNWNTEPSYSDYIKYMSLYYNHALSLDTYLQNLVRSSSYNSPYVGFRVIRRATP